MKIFYRKNDNAVVLTTSGNSMLESVFHIISGVYGGKIDDYEMLIIDDPEKIKKINSGYEIKLVSGSAGVVQIELIEPSPVESGPSMEEYIIDLDFRLSNLELGL